MLTKTMKWLSIAVLLPALFWQSSEDYQLGLQLVIPTGAILAAYQGFRSGKQIWAIGFLAVAILFNPFQPLTFSPGLFLWLSMISIAMFMVSLVVLKAAPRPAMSSIADY